MVGADHRHVAMAGALATTDAVPTPTMLSLLDIVIARYARNHGSHVSPLVGCYLCLTGVPHTARERRAAA
jgi:hypothetical protein